MFALVVRKLSQVKTVVWCTIPQAVIKSHGKTVDLLGNIALDYGLMPDFCARTENRLLYETRSVFHLWRSFSNKFSCIK